MMRRRGLHALKSKAFTPRTTASTHGLRCAPSWLCNQPRPTQTNQVWVSDSTCLPMANGDWAYLCAYQEPSNDNQLADCRRLTGHYSLETTISDQ